MKINAVSFANTQSVNFEGSKKNHKCNNPECRHNSHQVSNAALRNALKAMMLLPLAAMPLTSCDDNYEVHEGCHTIIYVAPPETPDIPSVKDTLYMGHIYELPEVKAPVRDFSGDKLDTVKIKSAQAYIPNSIQGSPILPVLDDFMNVLGISSKNLAPAEGKNKAVVDGLPLQFVVSNQSRQSVSAFKFNGFKSNDVSFAYDEVEYNKDGNVKSSTHYDLQYIDDKSVYVKKYDNFAPEKGVIKEVLMLNNAGIDRLVNVGGNNFKYAQTYLKGDENQSITVKGEHSTAKLSDIKAVVSKK